MPACPACGFENPEGFRFCGACGRPLEPAAPPTTREFPSERRTVTVLFADLVGFSSLAEHLDPEELRTAMGETFAACGSASTAASRSRGPQAIRTSSPPSRGGSSEEVSAGRRPCAPSERPSRRRSGHTSRPPRVYHFEADQKENGMATDPKQVVHEYLERAISGGEPEAYEELCDPEIVFTGPYSSEPLRGLEAFRETFLAMKQAFPDLQIEEEMAVADGDLVAARWTASGTHTGPAFAGLPAASGRRFEITGMSFYRVREGRIVEGWVNDDTLAMAAQLGLVPAAARA